MQSFANEHETLELLIARGGDLETKTSSSLPSLRILWSNRAVLEVKILLELGARTDTVGFEG
jgi:hypothetical protein